MKLLRTLRHIRNASVLVTTVFWGIAGTLPAQAFIHPGGLLTLADLQRMKTNVLAGNHPWIDGWNRLLDDSEARADWRPDTHANMGRMADVDCTGCDKVGSRMGSMSNQCLVGLATARQEKTV